MTTETVKTERILISERINELLHVKYEESIDNLYLRSNEKSALKEQGINHIKDFYLQECTCESLDAQFGAGFSDRVNIGIKYTGLPLIGKDEPNDEIYSIFLDSCREQLQGVHGEAYNIMQTVYWGKISKKTMSTELTYRKRGIIVTEKDIDLIINVSLLLLKARMYNKVNQDDVSTIIDEYPDLKNDVHSIGLEPLEASVLEGIGVPLVYRLYQQGITCDELDKGRCIKLSPIVNERLKDLGFPALAKSGNKPVGPFYALYRARDRR